MKILKWIGWLFGLISTSVLAYFYLRKREIPDIEELEIKRESAEDRLQRDLKAIDKELDENVKLVKQMGVSGLLARFKRNRDTLGDS